MMACVVRLKPSRCALYLVVIMHVLTLVAIVFYSTGWLCLIWLLAWLLSALWAGYGLRQGRVKKIEISSQGQASLLFAQGKAAVPAKLCCRGIVIRANMMALHWQTSRGRVYQLLLPDMTDAQAWRRLQVWVRWCQPNNTQSGLRQSILNKVIRRLGLKDKN